MPLLAVSCAWLLGLILASLLRLPVIAWLACAALAGASLLAARRWPRLNWRAAWTGGLPLAVLLIALFAGAAFYTARLPAFPASHVAWRNQDGQRYHLEGIIADAPQQFDRSTQLIIAVERIGTGANGPDQPAQGRILARLPAGIPAEYGQRVQFSGQLRAPQPSLDGSRAYIDYLARREVFSLVYSEQLTVIESGLCNPLLQSLYALRSRALTLTAQLWPDPEASLLAGILLGVESGIPPEVQQAFIATGTSHLIAISGFNISLLAGVFTATAGRVLGLWRGALVAGLGLAAYTLLVGADPPVVRALWMGLLGLGAGLIGRRQHALNSLGFTAMLMTLFDAQVMWEVSFQYTYAATLGLVLYAGPFSQRIIEWAKGRFPGIWSGVWPLLADYFLVTLVAQIATLPVSAYHFQRTSLSALLVNPLVLPVQPPIMILGGLAVLTALLWPGLGQVFAWLAWPLAAYTGRVIELFAATPGSDLALGPTPAWPWLLLGLAALLAPMVLPKLPGGALGFMRRTLPLAGVLGLLAAAVIVWNAVFAAPDGRLHLTMLEAGRGVALLIQSPAGRMVLINGGERASQLSDGLGRRMPLAGPGLDALVIANTDEQHVQALPGVIERYRPGFVLWSGQVSASYPAAQLHQHLVDEQITVETAQAGQVLDLGGGAQLTVLAAGERGAVLLLSYERYRALLPIGLDVDSLASLPGEVGPVHTLLLAEGGTAALNPPGALAHYAAQVVLLSLPPADGRGLPDPAVIDSLGAAQLLRSDQHGWVEVTSDGAQVWVTVERNAGDD